MRNCGFQVTEEDVASVIDSNVLARPMPEGVTLEQFAAERFAELDFDLIEDAALYGDDIDEQTDYANNEIARQLLEAGYLEHASNGVIDAPRG